MIVTTLFHFTKIRIISQNIGNTRQKLSQNIGKTVIFLTLSIGKSGRKPSQSIGNITKKVYRPSGFIACRSVDL